VPFSKSTFDHWSPRSSETLAPVSAAAWIRGRQRGEAAPRILPPRGDDHVEHCRDPLRLTLAGGGGRSAAPTTSPAGVSLAPVAAPDEPQTCAECGREPRDDESPAEYGLVVAPGSVLVRAARDRAARTSRLC
jgi:hypothetical protein